MLPRALCKRMASLVITTITIQRGSQWNVLLREHICAHNYLCNDTHTQSQLCTETCTPVKPHTCGVSGNTWLMEECLALVLFKHTITVYYRAAQRNTIWYTGISQEMSAQSSSPPLNGLIFTRLKSTVSFARHSNYEFCCSLLNNSCMWPFSECLFLRSETQGTYIN